MCDLWRWSDELAIELKLQPPFVGAGRVELYLPEVDRLLGGNRVALWDVVPNGDLTTTTTVRLPLK